MKKLVVILVMFFVPTAALANDDVVVKELVSFVEESMNVKMVEIPTIIVKNIETTTKTVGTPVGLYQNNTIYLKHDIDTLKGKAILIHELVHHIQHEQQIYGNCLKSKEYQAYHIQNEFLLKNGSNNVVDEGFIKKASACEKNS